MLKPQIKQLYQDGLTQIEISRKLNCSKSVVSYHINDVHVNQKQKPCINCGKITKNAKFCCLSCAAKYNNKLSNGIKQCRLKNKCIMCLTPIPLKHKRCKTCRQILLISIKNQTLQQCIISSGKYSGRYANVRDHAKRLYLKSYRSKKCLKCGYEKHIDICHIKPISQFDISTPISTINSNKNLVGLCKNCHWELDRHMISSDEIQLLVLKELNDLDRLEPV